MTIANYITNLPLETLHQWGYLIILAASLLESVPLLGMVVPGQTIVIFGGFLGRLHLLHPSLVFIISCAGAIIGDFVGFLIGKKCGLFFVEKYGKYFFFKPSYFEKANKLIK